MGRVNKIPIFPFLGFEKHNSTHSYAQVIMRASTRPVSAMLKALRIANLKIPVGSFPF